MQKVHGHNIIFSVFFFFNVPSILFHLRFFAHDFRTSSNQSVSSVRSMDSQSGGETDTGSSSGTAATSQSAEQDARMLSQKRLESFILVHRMKLKKIGICERGCQRVLCYSNNFLHKKSVSGKEVFAWVYLVLRYTGRNLICRPAYLYRFSRDIPILALNHDFPISCGGVPIFEDAGIFRARRFRFVLFSPVFPNPPRILPLLPVKALRCRYK